MTKVKTYIHTEDLEAILYKDGDLKLTIYKSSKSPYGYTRRDLVSSDYGVSSKEFTFDYVKSKVDEVYSTFPNTEIDELLTKIKQYNNG
jgi:hypothetical protein|tara:strand:- start:153 stop:419 length:267 start_codon:yes stop_codon:yes gene_type:complete